MNAIIEKTNSVGYAFIEFALPMLIQASVLIVLLLLGDLVLRKRVRAVFRYWILMLILVKLVLPTSLSGPFSLGYWFGDEIASVDVGRNIYEPPSAISESPAPVLPYINVSNVRPAVYSSPTAPSVTETEAISVEPIAPPPVQIQWQGVVFLLWLAIVIALLLLLAQRAIFVRSLVVQAKNANRPMCDVLNDCRKGMKVKRRPSLKVSPNATTPAVCGLFRPVILVPNNLSTALGSEDLQVVLLHELAHIKRGDLWVNLGQTLLQIIYFYNPLLWLANAVIRRAREQAVDEAVLVTMGEKASRYPQTLVSVAKLAFKRPTLSLRLIGVVESKSALTARIKRILSRPIPKSAKLGILGLAAIIITAAFILPMAQARGYTERAAKVMKLAEKEARGLNHAYIGTEHILLALAEQSDGVAAKVLDKLGIGTDALQSELKKLIKTGSEAVTKSRLPQTPRAKKALQHARNEARAFDHDYIGTEHILLGLMQEKDGVAAQMLAKLGVSLDVARAEVLDFVKPGPNANGGDEDEPPKPLTGSYEKAKGSKNLKIKVGPTTFKVNAVVRWDSEGTAHFEDGLGDVLTKVAFMTPGYSKQAPWMDIANIHISPDWERYDVLELRVFDHQTREMLSPKGRIGVGYDIDRSVVQLRSIGAPLPDSVDVWFRLLHNPSDDKVWTVNAKSLGKPVQLYREQISLRTIKDGLWSHSTKQPAGGKPGQIQWTKRLKEGDVCMAVFDFSNVKRRFWGKDEKYQICAVGVDGKRYVPDFPHFIGVVSGTTEIIRFGLPAEKVSRFEIRPFHGRDKFYFDNVKLPRIGQRTFDPPPIVTARVTGTRAEFTSSVLHPIRVKVRVLPGIAAASAQGGSGTLAARVYPIHGPKNLDTQTTVIYDIHGIQLNRCFLSYLDHEGNRVRARPTIDISQGAPARQFTGFETVPIPIEKIDQIRLSLVEDDSRLSEVIRVPTELAGRAVDGQGKPIADAQVALSTETIGVRISDGKLEPIHKDVESRIVETDSAGRFDLGEYPNADFDLVVACDEGFAFVQSKEFLASREIPIRPWGRLEGQLAPDRKATENQIWMAALPNWTFLPHRQQLTGDTICDAEGRFAFEKVPAGWFEVGYLVPTGEGRYSHTCRTPVEVEAGQTSNMTVGGTGRPIVGRFVPPAGYDEPIAFEEGLRSLVRARPKKPRPDNYEQMTEEEQRRWYAEWRKTDEYQNYLNAGWRNKDWRQYTFRINNDGSFRIEDVIAGKYGMTVSIERLPAGGPAEEIAGYHGTIEVPAIAGGRSDEPMDLGTLDLHIVDEEPPAETASPQPAYSAELANGVTVELLGICEHPSEGKQWWGVDGRPIAAPYERLKSSHRSDDSELYEVVYRVFGSEDIRSHIYSNSTIGGHTGLIPFSQKAENLNIRDAANAYGAILYVKPDAEFIRLEIGAGRDSDWKTLCSQPSPVDETGINCPGVVFKPAIEKDGETYVTIAHLIKDRRIRVIAVDHSGEIHESTGFDGTVGKELGSCQVRFDLAAEKIKEIQFQTQKFQRVTFKNIPLRPGHKTDVEIEVEKAAPNNSAGDSERIQRLTFKEGMFIRQALQFLGERYKKNIILSDKVTGQVPVTDLYDVTFEGTLQAILGTHKYIIDGDFIRVYTKEEFESIYSGHKTDVQIEVEPMPKGHSTVDSEVVSSKTSRKYSATLPNGVKITFLAFSKVSEQGLTWQSPEGKPITIGGVSEADVEGLGTVLAFGVGPTDIEINGRSLSGSRRESLEDLWPIDAGRIWLAALGKEPRFVNVEFDIWRFGPEVSHTIDLKQVDRNKDIEIGRFGVASISEIRSKDTNSTELTVHWDRSVERWKWKLAELTAIDKSGRPHLLHDSAGGRGYDYYRGSVAAGDLASIILKCKKRHPGTVRFNNLSLVSDYRTDVRIEVEGYADSNAADVQVKGTASETAKLDISGFVTDENGVAIVGAVASIMNKDLVLSAKPIKHGEREHFVLSAQAHGVTGSDGRFKVAGLKPGRTDISIHMKGYRTEFLRDIPTGTKNLQVILGEPSAYTLAGKVVDTKGNPVGDAEVTLAEKSYTTVRTNRNGEFRFVEELKPGAFPPGRMVFARKQGFGISGKMLDVTGAETFVEITLPPEVRVSGRVLDAAEEPIPGATVVLLSSRDKHTDIHWTGEWREIAPKARTDAEGNFTLAGMPAESIISLRTSAPDYTREGIYGIKTGAFNGYAMEHGDGGTMILGVSLEADDDIEFKLNRGATLRGLAVYEDSGEPASGVRIAGESAQGWSEAQSDLAGRFELKGVKAGPCNVRMLPEDSKTSSPPEWTAKAIEIDAIKAGQTINDLKLVLTKGAIVRGKAVDAGGNPLRGIEIRVVSDARPGSWEFLNTHTGEDGAWAYRCPPGDVKVHINMKMPQGAWSKSEYTLNLEKGQVIDNIDFRLSQEVPGNSPYRKIPANKTGVQIEVGSMPKGYSTVDAQVASPKTRGKYSATLANGATVELAAYSRLTEKGLEWYAPDGTSTVIEGVTEADLDGLGTVLAFRIAPADIDLTVYSYRGTETKNHGSEWRVESSDIWLVSLREKRRFVNLAIWVTVHGSPISHTIDLPGRDFDPEIEVNKLGVGKVLVIGPQDSDFSEVKVYWDSHRGKWKFTGLRVLDKAGESHGLTDESRGTSRYHYFKAKTKIPRQQLAAIVLEAKKRHPCEAKFKNVSLVPGKKTDVEIEVEPMPEGYGPVDMEGKGGAGETAKSYRKRYFATLVATDGGVIFKGKKLAWNQLEDALKEIPDREITALEVAFDPAIVPGNLRGRAMLEWIGKHADFQKADRLRQDLGFESISNVGADRVDSRRGPVSVRFEDTLRFGEEIPLGLESFEEQPLVWLKSIKFDKATGRIEGVLKIRVTSYPKKKWEIGVRLSDERGMQIESVVETFENSGYIAGYPLRSEETMRFSFAQVTDLTQAKRFEVKLREFTPSLAAGAWPQGNPMRSPPGARRLRGWLFGCGRRGRWRPNG